MKPALFGSFWIVVFLLSGCSQFFSKDISANSITVFSPVDSSYYSDGTVQFWWEEDTDVEQFRLQVVTPDFQTPFLILDTLLSTNTFLANFDEDRYTWRIRGENEDSETAWVTQTFVVDKSAPSAPQAIYPADDTLNSTNKPIDTLRWSSFDFDINGFVPPVSDSVYLFFRGDSTRIKTRFFRDFDQPRMLSVDLQNDFSGPGTYWWQVVTFDYAGNKRSGVRQRFVIQ